MGTGGQALSWEQGKVEQQASEEQELKGAFDPGAAQGLCFSLPSCLLVSSMASFSSAVLKLYCSKQSFV
jgi:hypothetical protein